MCDCFHLAFPNWHGSPGTGAGRRLKGPEPEDDSVCEDPPEFTEGERPRPQGSSPVNEYPATEKYTDLDKEREEEIDDPYQKSSGGKKGKKVGFGSFFEKRSKMSQEECPESGVIVKTAKEVCAEGLVVTGGGKEGIFIKEVKAESPAAKHLSGQEGDQILSATVYFDNVSYEDALQILEHAQPYKMELCLKRKPPAASNLESSTVERQEVAPGEEGAGSLERGRTKTQRRQDARISWPKFPSFTRGRKAHFKRSHSTSEAEEQRKLEMSPTTSDTESPMKSQEPAKDKKTKKQKMKLSKLKIKGVKSKSVEQQDKDSIVPVSRSLENMQPQQTEQVLDKHSPLPQERIFGETPDLFEMDQQEKKETTKTRTEFHFPDISGAVTETSQHRTELITLDKTLKTTDISDLLADRGSFSTKKSPDLKKKKKKERSELKVNIQGKEKEDLSPEGLLKSPQTLILRTSSDSLKTPDMGARMQDLSGNIMDSSVISHTELKRSPIAIDINNERIDPNKSIPKVDKKSSAEKTISTTAMMGDVDISLPKVDMSLDMSDVGLLKKSPRIKSAKEKRERSILILDSERYGIRPRGPMADISTTKKYLGKGNLLDNDSEISKPKSPKMKTSFPDVKGQEITATRKDASVKMETAVDVQSTQLEIQASKSPKVTHIDDGTEKIGMKPVPKFKIPKIEVPDFNVHESIVKTEVEASKARVDVKGTKVQDRMPKIDSTKPSTAKQVDIKIELRKREDIVIPGMEATALAGNLQTPEFDLPETGKIDVETYAKKIQADVKVDEIKDTISKTDLHTFKLPRLDISSPDVDQQITKSDVTAEKVKLDLTTDVSQSKTPEMEVKGQDLKIKASDYSTEIGIHCISGEIIKRTIPTHKIPKIDSPDPQAHEPICMAHVSSSKTKVEIHSSKIEGKLPITAVDGGMLEISSSYSEMEKIVKPELPKREDIEIPGMESTSTTAYIQTADIQLPGIGKQDASEPSVEIQAKKIHQQINVGNIKDAIANINLPTFKLPKVDSDFDVHEQITKSDVKTEKSKSPKQHGKDLIVQTEGTKGKFKIPPKPEYDVSFSNLKSDVKLTKEFGEERETGEIKCISDTEIPIVARTDIKSASAQMVSQNKHMKVEVKLGAAVTDPKAKEPKKSKVPIPTLGITQPDIKFPEAGQFGIKSPKVTENIPDVTTVVTKPELETQSGKVSVKFPGIDIKEEPIGTEKSKDKIELPELQMQNINVAPSKIKSPKIIIKSTQIETKILVSKPDMDFKTPEVDLKSPSLEINADILETGETKGTFQIPHMKIPSFGISKPKVKDSKLDADVSTSKLENVENESQENGFKLPKSDISLPKVKGPAIDFHTSKTDIPQPEVETQAALPAVEFEGLSIEGKAEISDIDVKGFGVKIKKPKMSLPEFEFSKSDIKKPETDASFPQGDASPKAITVDVKGPEMDIKGSETQAEIEGKHMDTSGSPTTFKLPTIKFPKVGISVTKAKTEATDINSEITVPEVKTPSLKVGLETGASDIHIDKSLEIDRPSGKTELLKMKQPDIDVSLPKIKDREVNLKKQFQTDVSVPIGTESPSLDIVTAEIADVESGGKAKFQIPHIKIPSFGIPKLELEAPEAAGDISLPSTDISLKKQDKDIRGHVSIDGTSVDIDTQDSTLSGKISEADIKGPCIGAGPAIDTDIKDKNAELGQESTFKLPKFGISLPKLKGPGVDISTTKPDVDISLPEVTVKAKFPGVEVEGPAVEGTLHIPERGSGDGDLKVKKPSITLPKFGFTKPDVKAPEMEVNIPEEGISVSEMADVTGPEIESSDIDVHGDTDIDASSSKFKRPAFKMPKIGVTVPTVKATVVRAEIIEPEIKAPSVEVDIDHDHEIQKQEGTFELPKVKIPKIDLSLSKSKGLHKEIPKAGVELSVSETDVVMESTVEGRSLHKQAEIPDIETAEHGKFKMPHIKLPSFGFSKPEITGPTISGDVHLPSADIAVTTPNAPITAPGISAAVPSADMKLQEPPEVEIKDYSVDLEGPGVNAVMKGKGVELEGQGSKFKLPKFGISLPKVKGPAVDISISKPDVDISLPEMTTEAQLPDMEVEGPSIEGNVDIPEVDVKGADITVKKPKISLPKFGFSKPNVKAPETDISLQKGDISLAGGIVEIKEPRIDITAPDIDDKEDSDVRGSPSKFKVPSLKLPKFGIAAPKVKAEGPDPSANITVPETEGKFELPAMKIPNIDVKAPILKGPDMSQEIPKAEYEISVPDTVKVDLKGRSLDGQTAIPDIEAGAGEQGRFTMPHIKLPSFGFSKPEITAPKISGNLPSVNIAVTKPNADITVPDISADVTSAGVKLPGADLAVLEEIPAVDTKDYSIAVEAPDIDIDIKGKGTELDGQGGKFKLPKFGISFPKAKGPAVDISASKPDVDISLPEVKAEAKLPGVEVKGPSVEGTVDIPEVDSKEFDVKLKKPKMSFPKFGFSKPEITAPKISGNLNLPSVDIAVTKPNADITVPDISADVTSAGVKLPGAYLAVSEEIPAVDTKDYSIAVEAPDIDIDIKGKGTELDGQGGKFKLPKFGISFPKAKGPAVDINASKPDVDISLPEVRAEAKLPGVEVEGPSVEGTVDIPEVDSKEFDVKLKKPKMSFPKFGFSKPEITAPKISGNLNLPSVDIAVTKPNADITVPDISADVTSAGVKLPGADLAVSEEIPAVHMKDYSIAVEAPDVDIDIKGKGTELDGQGGKFKLPKFGISFPKAKGPAVDISSSKPDVDISLPEVTAEAKLPVVEAEGPSAEGTVDIPEVDSKEFDVKLKKPLISFPKFGFSKPDVTAPEIDISLPKGDISLAGGSVEVKEPGMDIKAPDGGDKKDSNIKGSPSKFKVPTFKLPKFGITAPKVKAETPDLSVNITVPETEIPSGKAIIDYEGTGIETGTAEGKFELPAMKIPNIDVKVPTLKGPDMSQEIPKAEYEISVSDTVKVDLKGSSLDGQAAIPDIEAGAGEQGRFKMPHIKFPSFGFSKPQITAPKISGNVPSVDIAVTKPNADINVPDTSADVTSAGMKLQEAHVAVSGEIPPVDINDYNVDVEVPDVDVDTKGKIGELEGQGGKFKLPKFGISFPKAKGPAVDISVSRSDVDIAQPEVTAVAKLPGVEVEGPSVEGTVDIPEVDSKELNVKLKKPKISFPKFGFSKPDVTAPEIDISIPQKDISLAGGSVEVKEPGMDIKAPDVGDKEDSNIKGSPSKFKVPTFKLPKLGIAAPKVKAETPDLSVNITVPEIETSSGKIDTDHKGTVIETGKAEGKFELPAMKIPNIDIKAPTLKGLDMSQEIPKAEYEISVPDTVKVDLKGSSLDGQAEVPDIHAGAGEQGRFKMPHIKFPSFGFSKSEITAPKISGNLNLPSIDIAVTKPTADITVPDISTNVTSAGVKLPEVDLAVSGEPPAVDIKDYNVDVEGPDVGVDMKGKGTELEGQGSKFKLPKFGISFQKAKGPAVDISVSKPDVDISHPEVTVEAKLPGVEVEGPSVEGTVDIPQVDSKEVDVAVKKPKMSFPKFGFSKPDVKAPEVDVSFPKGEISLTGGNVEVKDPGMDIKAPDTQTEIKDKDIDIVGSPTKFKLPTIKFPKFGISVPKITTESPDIKTDVKLPEMKTSEKVNVDIEAPSVDIDVSLPKAKGSIKTPDIDVNLSEVDMSLPESNVDVKGSVIAIKTQDTEANVDVNIGGSPSKFKLPTFKFPKFGVSAAKITTESPDIKTDVKLPELKTSEKVNVDIEAPSVDIDVSLPKTKGFIKTPDIDMNLPEVDMSLPESKVDVKGSVVGIKTQDTEANVDVNIGGSPSKFKLPTFKLPKFGFTGSKEKAEIPEVSAESTEPEIEDLSGKLDVKHVEQGMDIEKPAGKFELPKVKMPDISFSLPKAKGIEIQQEIPEAECNISVTETDTVLQEPKLKGMHIDGQAEIQGIEAGAGEQGKFKMPHIKMPSFGFSKPEITAPKISGDVHLPSVDIAVTKSDSEMNVSHISAGVTSVGGKYPEPQLTMSGETTAVDIKDYSVAVEGPDLDIDMKGKGTELEGQGSKFKLPKFGISFPKAKGPAADISVSKPDVDISLPEVTIETKLPGVEVEGPPIEGTFNVPEVDSKGVNVKGEGELDVKGEGELDVKVKKPKISFPKFGFSKPEGKAPELEVSLPKGDISLTEGSVEVKGPEVDITAPETQIEIQDKDINIISSPTKFKLPTIKFPKFGISASKVTAEPSNAKTVITVPEIETSSGQLKVDVGAPSFDIEKSSVDLDEPKEKKMLKMEMPGIDISLPKVEGSGSASIDVDSPSFKADMKGPEPEGQGSRFKFPKFGISFQKVKGPEVDISESKPDIDISSPEVTVEAQLPSVEIEGPSIEGRIDVPEVDSKEVDLKVKKPRISFPKFGFSKPDVKGPEIDVNIPKGGISLTEGSVEMKGPDVDIKAPDTQIEIKDKDMDIVVSPTKFKLPTFKFPKFGAVAPKSKAEAHEVSAEITAPQIDAPLVKAELDVGAPDFETDVLSIEVERSEGTVKLPKLKMTSIERSAVLPQEKTDVSELEATDTALEAQVDLSDPEPPQLEVGTKGSPSKFKLPTFKIPKFGFSTAKVKTTDTDVDIAVKTSDVPIEGATKEIEESIDDGSSNVTVTDKKTGDAAGQPKSSNLILSTIGDVFKGFDLEFNVPTLEEVEESLPSPGENVAHSGKKEQSTHKSAEKDSNLKFTSHTDQSQIELSTTCHGAEVSVQAPTITKEAEAKEKSKFKFRFPRLGFTESTEQDDKTESIKVNVEEKSLEPQEEKEDIKEKEANTDKGTWFKFPTFGITSPSKTINDSEKGTSQPSEGIDKSIEGDIEEEDISLTSSVRSSDAFADISSTVMSEQPGPLVLSPTKVKVKISEPTTMVGVSEVKVPTDIITSTARTELILLEHHLPEKVDKVTIPVSSEATLTSPDELTQETGGDIHVVTSNIQATPSSEHATVITKYETRSVQALSMQKMTVKVGSAGWSVEGSGEMPGESSEENILVEKYMVKEKSGDDKAAVLITQRVTQIVGANSGEPILEDAASAIKKLRDTMHSEKMKFFEDAETSTVTVSTQKIEKHVFESSTEKKCV